MGLEFMTGVEEDEEKLKRVSTPVRQLIHRKLAQFCVQTLGNDIYFLTEVVTLLRAEVGEEILKEKYGKKYDFVVLKLKGLSQATAKIKIYYDSLEKKELNEENKEKKIKHLFRKEMKKMKISELLLYEVFILYINKCNLKFMSIPNQAFQIETKRDKRFKFGKEKEGSKEKGEEE